MMTKCRVAPVKQQIVPCLEICGAHLLAKLLIQVAADLSIPEDSIFTWTDSLVVPGWLRTPSSQLKVFVSHRVNEIVSKVAASHWKYVRTNCNPAGIISRGSKPSDLMKNSLWWKGPPWLSQSLAHWPSRHDLDRR